MLINQRLEHRQADREFLFAEPAADWIIGAGAGVLQRCPQLRIGPIQGPTEGLADFNPRPRSPPSRRWRYRRARA